MLLLKSMLLAHRISNLLIERFEMSVYYLTFFNLPRPATAAATATTATA